MNKKYQIAGCIGRAQSGTWVLSDTLPTEPMALLTDITVWPQEKSPAFPLLILRKGLALTPIMSRGWKWASTRDELEEKVDRPVLRVSPAHIERLIGVDHLIDEKTKILDIATDTTVRGIGKVDLIALIRVGTLLGGANFVLFNASPPGVHPRRLVGAVELPLRKPVSKLEQVVEAVIEETPAEGWKDFGRAYLEPSIYTSNDLSAMGLEESPTGLLENGLYRATDLMEGDGLTMVRGTFLEATSTYYRGYPALNLGRSTWWRFRLKPVTWIEDLFWS